MNRKILKRHVRRVAHLLERKWPTCEYKKNIPLVLYRNVNGKELVYQVELLEESENSCLYNVSISDGSFPNGFIPPSYGFEIDKGLINPTSQTNPTPPTD